MPPGGFSESKLGRTPIVLWPDSQQAELSETRPKKPLPAANHGNEPELYLWPFPLLAGRPLRGVVCFFSGHCFYTCRFYLHPLHIERTGWCCHVAADPHERNGKIERWEDRERQAATPWHFRSTWTMDAPSLSTLGFLAEDWRACGCNGTPTSSIQVGRVSPEPTRPVSADPAPWGGGLSIRLPRRPDFQ